MKDLQERGQVARATTHDKYGLEELKIEEQRVDNLDVCGTEHKYDDGAFPQHYKGKFCLQGEPQL